MWKQIRIVENTEEKCRRKYGQYGRKISWIVKRH